MKEKLDKMHINKKNIIFVLGLVVLFGIGYSFAYWNKNINQTGLNTTKIGCFNVSYTENTSAVTLSNAYPQADDDGIKNDAYKITIKNTCRTYSKYDLVLNVLNTSTLADSNVKVAYTDSTDSAKLLTSYTSTTSNLSDAKSAYILTTGALRQNQSVTYKIRTWMDVNTTESEGENKAFNSRVTVSTSAILNYPLAGLIKNEEIVTSGDGLYKARGDQVTLDNKTTLYYKGKNVNNYLEMGGQSYRIVRLNEDGTIRIVSTTGGLTFYNTDNSSSFGTDSNTSSGTVTGYTQEHLNSVSDYSAFIATGKFCNTGGLYNFYCASPISSKVGLITLGEFSLAGGQDSYLFTGQTFWTMSAYNDTDVYYINFQMVSGTIIYTRPANTGTPLAYPVLNLSADTRVTGSGTESDPYVVVLF